MHIRSLNLPSNIRLLLGLLLILFTGCKNAIEFKKGNKLLFLGDSITFDGRYIDRLNQHLTDLYPELELILINAGKNSETVSGLSEPIHDPRRPMVMDRLDAIIDEEMPDLVFVCYGINDGIYHPFSQQRFEKYKSGLIDLLDRLDTYKIPVVLMTPTPFHLVDGVPENGDEEVYSWKNPYPDYDKEVVSKMRELVLNIQHSAIERRVDTYKLLDEHRSEAYTKDPIHPNERGHEYIAQAIIDAIL